MPMVVLSPASGVAVHLDARRWILGLTEVAELIHADARSCTRRRIPPKCHVTGSRPVLKLSWTAA